MSHLAIAFTVALMLGGLGVHASHTRQDPVLPPGHTPVSPRRDVPARAETPPARPDDVASIDAIVDAYYDSISGPTNQPRDWDRFRSLFVDGATLATSSSQAAGGVPIIMNPEQFASLNDHYFTGSGYDERSIHRRTVSFGHVAQVFSTYESRRQQQVDPYSRGVNSFQLIESGQRWWIVSVAWDRERGETRLGAEHLPPAASPPASVP